MNSDFMKNCSAPDFFKCDDNRKCLPIQFLCDKSYECPDKSDESHCHDVCIIRSKVQKNYYDFRYINL